MLVIKLIPAQVWQDSREKALGSIDQRLPKSKAGFWIILSIWLTGLAVAAFLAVKIIFSQIEISRRLPMMKYNPLHGDSPMHTAHILLVDDEERFVLNLAKLLKARGLMSPQPMTASKPLIYYRPKRSIDVVVLDVRMPGMNGIETLQHIKDRYPDIEVIMLTGQASLKDGIQAMRRGAFDYIQKPCDIDELEALIRDALRMEQIKRHPVLWRRSTRRRTHAVQLLSAAAPGHPWQRSSIFDHYRHGEGARNLFVVDDQRSYSRYYQSQ